LSRKNTHSSRYFNSFSPERDPRRVRLRHVCVHKPSSLLLKKAHVQSFQLNLKGCTRHDKSHTTYRQPIHLPTGQMVYFRFNGDNLEEATDAARSTALTEYFCLNQKRHSEDSPFARFALTLSYSDIYLSILCGKRT
jgi:hypothetical protein